MFLRSVAWAAIILSTIAAPSFAATTPLIDQRGISFTFESLRGAPLVVTFISAHCDTACPIVEAQIARAADDVAAPSAQRFLTITLDPERDTAADMHRLAARFGANPNRWIVATGATVDVHQLMHRFGVVTQRDGRGFASAHTTFVYVLDSQLRIRRQLLPSDDLAQTLLKGGLQ